MKLSFVVISAALLVSQFFLAQGLFLPWSKIKNDSTDGFLISMKRLDLNRKYEGSDLEKLKNITRQVSLDNRCFEDPEGPISVGFHSYHPYVSFAMGGKSLHLRGMFPSILADTLDYCCQGGMDKVKFAKMLKTPLEAEDRFLSDDVNEYDFTFPVHAPEGTKSFRDHPFIPLVHVPSVVFLAYDGNERTTKTHAIAATILKAWPIMVFILLTATFSGIIIWFLIGVVNGSEEYKLGVLMNAEMKIFPTIYGVTHALLESKIDGAFVDSFTITAHLDTIKSHPIRTERTIEHPVTYGMVLAGNSTRMADCARRYLENYPRKVFQRIADHLKPLKNPSDSISEEVMAAEKLFYEEGAFKLIVYCGVAILGLLFIAGLLYEVLAKKYLQPKRLREENNYQNVELVKQTNPADDQASNPTEGDLEELLQDYKAFHDSWVAKCKRLHGKPYGC
ncbi:hypothetical protein pdam_00002046 [Pocillopora damicornis]|uniref:Uncharacterized protein n=1 Tax=Pocillopora damicornis TaxID=46731 RepID=A0A3M6TXN4_POCDA|nr:hypothetical protein pdam_00002046 [Pocillopora damicornis]